MAGETLVGRNCVRPTSSDALSLSISVAVSLPSLPEAGQGKYLWVCPVTRTSASSWRCSIANASMSPHGTTCVRGPFKFVHLSSWNSPFKFVSQIRNYPVEPHESIYFRGTNQYFFSPKRVTRTSASSCSIASASMSPHGSTCVHPFSVHLFQYTY